MADMLADRPLVLYGMTSGVSARGFIRGQAPFLRERGWNVALVCSEEADVVAFAAEDGIDFHPLQLERNPSVVSDARSALGLLRLVGRMRPDVTLWGSPKASLLGVIASRLLRVPSVYVVHGLRLEGASGLGRRILTILEAVTCRLANTVVADGYELRAVLERHRIIRPGRAVVLADGSCNGVGAAPALPRYRAELGLMDEDLLVTFAGRITGDKGVGELCEAWEQVARAVPRAHLVVAGRVDGPDPRGPALVAALERLPRTHLLGHVDDLDRLWADSDVCVLPSYREGLPLVVIEAAAAGVPAVVSDCTGGREVVEDGVTGVVVPRRDADALAGALQRVLSDGRLREELGRSARSRALARYDRHRLWGALEQLLRTTAAR